MSHKNLPRREDDRGWVGVSGVWGVSLRVKGLGAGPRRLFTPPPLPKIPFRGSVR